MRAMPDDQFERPAMTTRREEMEQKLAVIETKARALAQRHGRLAAGIALTAAAAFSLGMLFYRRRQQKSVTRRVQSAIPGAVWDLPEEIVAQLKKPLMRAAKAL
jgi:hypothetical protein